MIDFIDKETYESANTLYDEAVYFELHQLYIPAIKYYLSQHNYDALNVLENEICNFWQYTFDDKRDGIIEYRIPHYTFKKIVRECIEDLAKTGFYEKN